MLLGKHRTGGNPAESAGTLLTFPEHRGRHANGSNTRNGGQNLGMSPNERLLVAFDRSQGRSVSDGMHLITASVGL
jgi:hypothetical protein